MGAIDRAKIGRPTRLTEQVLEDVCVGLRTGSPPRACMEFVGVSGSLYDEWRKIGRAAKDKRPGQRTQMERKCIAFLARTDQAVADYRMRANSQMAAAAGLMRERPKRRRTTQRILNRGGETITVSAEGAVSGGVLVEVLIVEEELAADWRANDRMLARRFHQDYTGDQGIGDTEGPAAEAREVTDGALWAALERARARANLPAPEVIEARSWPSDGPAELARATAPDDPGEHETERG